MAAGSFVVVRRTISQTIVPYKDVEERLLLKRSKSKSSSLGFSSTNNVSRCGVANIPDARRTQKDLKLERSRSEVCLRRRSTYVRDTSLDVFEERREEDLVKPVVQRREMKRVNMARPQSDFFPEFSVEKKKTVKVENKDAGKRLGRCIATLKREMMSLRKQDQALLKQLMSLNEHIQDLKEIVNVQGGGSIENQNDSKQLLPSTTLSSLNSPTIEPSSTKKNSGRKEREKNVETTKKERIQKIANGIQGLQETSFEYIEVPCNPPKTAPLKATAKRSQSTTIADVSRKRISSLRLERKSLSCQFLDSARRDDSVKGSKRFFTESHETLASTGVRKARPLSLIDAEKSKDTNNTNGKQKSLSLCQLRPVAKNVEGSTSDSECSTSGCYGGSSTGSDVELERSYFNTRTGISNEKLDKLFELNSLNIKPLGRRHIAISGQGQFPKKIVSV